MCACVLYVHVCDNNPNLSNYVLPFLEMMISSGHNLLMSRQLWITGIQIRAKHYIDVIMTTMASQITSLTVVYSNVYSDADQKKTSKLRVTGLCVGKSPGPVNSPHKGPVRRKMFPFDDVIMIKENDYELSSWYTMCIRYNMTIITLYYSIQRDNITNIEHKLCIQHTTDTS